MSEILYCDTVMNLVFLHLLQQSTSGLVWGNTGDSSSEAPAVSLSHFLCLAWQEAVRLASAPTYPNPGCFTKTGVLCWQVWKGQDIGTRMLQFNIAVQIIWFGLHNKTWSHECVADEAPFNVIPLYFPLYFNFHSFNDSTFLMAKGKYKPHTMLLLSSASPVLPSLSHCCCTLHSI